MNSPTSQAMHLAMTELEHRRERIAELQEELAKERADAGRYRWLRNCSDSAPDDTPTIYSHRVITKGRILYGLALDEAVDAARSVLNKETNRG